MGETFWEWFNEVLIWHKMKRWRYHLEKVAHTAILALVFVAVSTLSLTVGAILSAVLYLGLGKAWYVWKKHTTPSWDWLADFGLSCIVVCLAAWQEQNQLGWYFLFPVLAYPVILVLRKTSP